MKRHILFLIVLAEFLVSHAAVRNFTIEGNVTYVQDFGFQLDASVTNGAAVKGFYVFDDSFPDQNADGTVGDYRFTNSTFGATVSVGKYVFRTNPEHVNFLLEVVNRERDNYLFISYQNVSSTGIPVGTISWQLDDPSGTAWTDDSLPHDPPILSAFPDIAFGLTIDGGGLEGYLVRAAITKITETPPIIPDPPEVAIKEAVEVTFPSVLGYFYQIQYSSDLQTWTNIGSPVIGDGTTLSKFVRKVSGKSTYYRANISTGP